MATLEQRHNDSADRLAQVAQVLPFSRRAIPVNEPNAAFDDVIVACREATCDDAKNASGPGSHGCSVCRVGYAGACRWVAGVE